MKISGLPACAGSSRFGIMPTAGRHWQDLPCYTLQTSSDPMSAGGTPEIAPRQNAGMFFQILPFMEQDAVWKGGQFTAALDKAVFAVGYPNPVYFCPSRRRPHQRMTSYHHQWFRDINVVSQLSGRGNYNHADLDYLACCQETSYNEGGVTVRSDTQGIGPIVRHAAYSAGPWVPSPLINTTLTFAAITDGLSNTLFVGEKRLEVGQYTHTGKTWNQDTGYASGWDGDVMARFIWNNATEELVTPRGDSEDNPAFVTQRFGTPCCGGTFYGSAHAGAMNALFGDGSVRRISYPVDPRVFARVNIRNDGLQAQID